MSFGLRVWSNAGTLIFDETIRVVRRIYAITTSSSGSIVLPGWAPTKGFVKITPVANAYNTTYWSWNAGTETLSWSAPVIGSSIVVEAFEVE